MSQIDNFIINNIKIIVKSLYKYFSISTSDELEIKAKSIRLLNNFNKVINNDENVSNELIIEKLNMYKLIFRTIKNKCHYKSKNDDIFKLLITMIDDFILELTESKSKDIINELQDEVINEPIPEITIQDVIINEPTDNIVQDDVINDNIIKDDLQKLSSVIKNGTYHNCIFNITVA